MDNSKKSFSWEHVRDFSDHHTGVVVRVNATDQHRPRYSFEIGRQVDDREYLARHFSVFVGGQGKVELTRPSLVETITRLVAEAEKFVLERCQEREDEIIEERMAKEKAQMERGKPKNPPGLKKLGKASKIVRVQPKEEPTPEAQGGLSDVLPLSPPDSAPMAPLDEIEEQPVAAEEVSQ